MDSVDDTTLLQKWREHWNTRDRIFNPPPQTANKMGVTLFWVSNIALMYTTLNVSAAKTDRVVFGLSCYWWRFVAWFLCFQTSYNWFLTSLKTLSQVTSQRLRRAFDRRGIMPPSGEHEMNQQRLQYQQLEEFETCPVCLLMAPPRSHHCKVCNCCVLKRDHHCFFTASCVGFNNQRYFVVFTFYATVGCVVGASLIGQHLIHTGASHRHRHVPAVRQENPASECFDRTNASKFWRDRVKPKLHYRDLSAACRRLPRQITVVEFGLKRQKLTVVEKVA